MHSLHVAQEKDKNEWYNVKMKKVLVNSLAFHQAEIDKLKVAIDDIYDPRRSAPSTIRDDTTVMLTPIGNETTRQNITYSRYISI